MLFAMTGDVMGSEAGCKPLNDTELAILWSEDALREEECWHSSIRNIEYVLYSTSIGLYHNLHGTVPMYIPSVKLWRQKSRRDKWGRLQYTGPPYYLQYRVRVRVRVRLS